MRDGTMISSLQNPSIKQVIRLRERRERDATGLFLIEGYRELLRAADAGREIERLYTCAELFLGENEDALIDKIASVGTPVFPCSRAVFEKMSYRDRPDGLLATAPQSFAGLSDLEAILQKKKVPFLVVAEAIEKPGNLGRSSARAMQSVPMRWSFAMPVQISSTLTSFVLAWGPSLPFPSSTLRPPKLWHGCRRRGFLFWRPPPRQKQPIPRWTSQSLLPSPLARSNTVFQKRGWRGPTSRYGFPCAVSPIPSMLLPRQRCSYTKFAASGGFRDCRSYF